MADDRETSALVALLQDPARKISWSSIAADVAMDGSALRVLESTGMNGLFSVDDSRLLTAATAIDQWRAAGYSLVTVLDPAYPERLRDIREVPPLLFYEGDLRPVDLGMSVVGSRNASEPALEFAAHAARRLVERDLTVISGLAKGVDAAAHRAALDARGRTVAVLGTGIARSYPSANATLQREIARHGLLLSQFYPDAPPTRQSFPMRNAVMSGYGMATVVVEAGEHSGARIQARLACEHGRPVILTERVATQTKWGRELAGAPSVHVVGGLADLDSAIDAVLDDSQELRRALTVLAG